MPLDSTAPESSRSSSVSKTRIEPGWISTGSVKLRTISFGAVWRTCPDDGVLSSNSACAEAGPAAMTTSAPGERQRDQPSTERAAPDQRGWPSEHRGGRYWPVVTRPSRRLCAAAALAALLGTVAVLLAPAPAGAHGLGGLEPTSYESRIVRVRPAVPGLEVRLLDLGEELEIDNGTGRDVQVLARRPRGAHGPERERDADPRPRDRTGTRTTRRLPRCAAHLTAST